MSRSARRDLLILAGIVCFFLSVYFYSDSVLVMHTDKHRPGVMIGIGVASFLYAFYLVRRYLRERNEKLLSSMGSSLGFALLLWGLSAFNYNKVPLLIGYWRDTPAHTTLPLLDVSKRRYKGSFNGGRIQTILGHDTVFLDCSRTLYFALKDKTSVEADFGRSADGRNLFVSKLYLDSAAYDAARSTYWQDWRGRRLPLLLGLAAILVVGAVLFKLDEAGIIRLRKPGDQKPEKPSPKRIFLLVLLFCGLTFLGIVLYILFMVLSHR